MSSSHARRHGRAAAVFAAALALGGCAAYAPNPGLAYGYGAYPYYPGYPAYAGYPYDGDFWGGWGWPVFAGVWGGGCCFGNYSGGYRGYGAGWNRGGYGGFHGGGFGGGMFRR